KGRKFYSDIWAIWDTFRAIHPLQHLVEPQLQDDVAQSLMENYYLADKLPMSPAPCYGMKVEMIGHHAVSVLAESYAKGRRNFNYEDAYAAMKYATTRTDIGSEGVPEAYARLGYMPAADEPHQDYSVSETLELTYDDWCVAEMAKALGYEEDYKLLSERAKNYKNVFDPKSGFVRRKREDDTWVEEFDPSVSHKAGFCETTAWEYTSLVPHDVQGIINLMGGDERMVEHIDGTFANERFNHTNETAFHIPFIYTFARAPYKTMEVCRNFMPTVNTNTPGGIYGEDDSGSLSAWFAFISLGLFPSCPARPCYTLTSPAFDRWTLRLPEGKTFSVIANNNSKENIYVQSATLNGKPHTRTWIGHDEIMAGGELVYEMGATPSDWGTKFEDAPPSLTTEAPKFTILSVSGAHTAQAGKEAKVTIRVRNDGADGTLDCKIFENGFLRGREAFYLDSNTEGEFTLSYVPFNANTKEILVGGIPFALTVTDPMEASLVYGAAKTDRYMRRHSDRTAKFTVTASVKNIGSYGLTAQIPCTLDGVTVETLTVPFAPGEEKTLSFVANPLTLGNHYAAIGDSEAVEIDVCGRPDMASWICWRGTNADFGAAGDNLYINASGNVHEDPLGPTSRMEYGILWQRVPVEGDFDVTVRVAYEEYSTPYTGHGIIVKNSMEIPFDDMSGYLQSGAMTTRGFTQWIYSKEEDEDNRYWALEGPTAPYWFKIEKRGQHFDCYYSTDEAKTWKWQSGSTYADAAKQQYVGLFVNSGTQDQRLVKFTDWNVTLVRI
ncbi:MAG: GH92 family glycosyl hydrolase, partial [Clostridia bacterium]|nr:GH92 family glycosyl hydrolase [Clostridia bacterium]